MAVGSTHGIEIRNVDGGSAELSSAFARRGTIESTYAGSFDLDFGIYYWKTQSGSDGYSTETEILVNS